MSGMLSVRRAVVIVCGLFRVWSLFPLTSRFSVNSQLDHFRAWIPACSLTSALLHRCFPSHLFFNYARGHCEAVQASNCSGVCWEERIGDGGVLVLQDVNTVKSLHWRCKMWVDCVERKRSAKLPWSATAPCTFAGAPSFKACLCAFIYTFCTCVCIYAYVCMCADM